MAVTESNGVKIDWSEQGTGTPALLIMGHSFTAASWWPVAPILAEHHRVVTFDNRGVGGSELGAPFAVADMVRDAIAVLDAAGIEKAHIYGVSMGGIALELAMSYPDRVTSLVLGCTMAKSVVLPPPSWSAKMVVRLIQALPKSLVRRLAVSRLYGPTSPEDRITKDRQILDSANMPMSAFVAQAEAIAAYATSYDRVEALQTPTLVLHGTDDPAVPYSEGVRLSELIPGARLETYEGARHNYLIDFGDRANAAVLALFADADKAQDSSAVG